METWILALKRGDERGLAFVIGRRRPWLDPAMRALTHMGGAVLTIGIALALLVGLLPGPAGAGATAAWTLASSHLVVHILKRTISRPRPSLPVGVGMLIEAPDRFSFPSGHAAASLSIALAVAPALPLGLAAAALGLPMLVGLTRCYLGVHYPGDVLTGWLLAFAAAAVCPI